jgi:hypothetical protein
MNCCRIPLTYLRNSLYDADTADLAMRFGFHSGLVIVLLYLLHELDEQLNSIFVHR